MDSLVWTLEHRGRIATVGEDGALDGDADLVDALRGRLLEPVTVWRDGTVRSRSGAGEPLVLQPGDGRYVVARIRTLCDSDAEWHIVDCSWR